MTKDKTPMTTAKMVTVCLLESSLSDVTFLTSASLLHLQLLSANKNLLLIILARHKFAIWLSNLSIFSVPDEGYFKKRVRHTKFDIYVFIAILEFIFLFSRLQGILTKNRGKCNNTNNQEPQLPNKPYIY
jgi:hypothetical protein